LKYGHLIFKFANSLILELSIQCQQFVDIAKFVNLLFEFRNSH